MRVRVKSWEKLVCEFGKRPNGTIDCLYGFHPAMQIFCGKEGNIIAHDLNSGLCAIIFDGEKNPNDDATWHMDMFEEIKERPKLRLC